MLNSLNNTEIKLLIDFAAPLQDRQENSQHSDDETSQAITMRERNSKAIKSQISHLDDMAIAELAALFEVGRNEGDKQSFSFCLEHAMQKDRDENIKEFSEKSSISHYLQIGQGILNK